MKLLFTAFFTLAICFSADNPKIFRQKVTSTAMRLLQTVFITLALCVSGTNGVCPPGDFECAPGLCMPGIWRCDGVDHCGTDELNCDESSAATTSQTTTSSSTCQPCDCTNLPDGQYQLEGSCTAYCDCSGGSGCVEPCPLVYDPLIPVCIDINSAPSDRQGTCSSTANCDQCFCDNKNVGNYKLTKIWQSIEYCHCDGSTCCRRDITGSSPVLSDNNCV